MANRYWVGGTASWDGTAGTKWSTTSGGAGGASVPTTADDVFFDANSTGTCTIATGNTGAKSINCTGFTGTIAGTAAITVAGSITLVAGMTYTHTGTVTISGTGTLTTAGKTFSNLTVNGSGITVTLGDNLNIGGRIITVTQGTFTTSANNYSITAGGILSTNSNTRTISLNGSSVLLSGTTNLIDFTTSTNLTFNAGTSTITCTGDGLDFYASGQTFYNVSFTGTNSANKVIRGANTFNDLSFSPPSANGLIEFQFEANQTINGTLTCAGATATRRCFIFSNPVVTTRTLTVNSLSADDCDFRDITIAGTAAGSSPTRAGDCGGNSGITFPAAKTVYWNLSGTQNWSATAWATTSGGSPAVNNFPLAQDTAIFDNSGSAGTVSIQAFNIGSVNMSARTSAMTMSFTAGADFYGSMAFGSGVTVSGTSTQTFSGRGTMDYTSAGKTTTFLITVDAPGGTFRLIDAFNSSGGITHTRGTFNANNQNVTSTNFVSTNSNVRTVTMGSGLWTLTGAGTIWSFTTTTNLTFNKDTANIVLSNTTTTARSFAGGGFTYNKLTIGGATGTSTLNITGSNTFSEIDSTKTVAHTIRFSENSTTTVTTWSVKGTSGNVVSLRSPVANTPYTLALAGGGYLTGIDYLDVRDAIGSPVSDTWYIGANSVINTTAANLGYGMFTTQRANNAIVVLTSTSSTSWTVPADWNDASNSINLIGGGGGGAGSRASGNNRAGGGGGGGGGFTRLTNQTLSGSITYQAGTAGDAGAAGADGTAGGTTSWNSGAATAGGGGGGQATTTPTSTGGAGGTGTTYNGGTGGAGSTSTAASTGNGGGGGGGAGGLNGVGGNGGNGFASTTDANIAGGGGGGNGGGINGGNASSATGGTGGDNSSGVGGGSSNTGGAVGGGGGGTVSSTSTGGNGTEFFGIGSGGGAGGADDAARTSNIGGFYGGGGGGAGMPTAGTQLSAAPGRQGAIIIVYTPVGAITSTGNFLGFFF